MMSVQPLPKRFETSWPGRPAKRDATRQNGKLTGTKRRRECTMTSFVSPPGANLRTMLVFTCVAVTRPGTAQSSQGISWT